MEKNDGMSFKRGLVAGLSFTQETLRKKIMDKSMQYYSLQEREAIVQFVNSAIDDLERKKKSNRQYNTEHGEIN